ncbi:SUKH-4 family immunity protein [Kitasatospora sp. NPDC001540]|uniref:SUKH-4 family immunity protein n=1 Tax=Kitasatospora sp. NPDC001540 TaxID=3364014 RepID=UPI0036C6A960
MAVTRAEMEREFGPDGLVRPPAERVAELVADPGAREFLTAVGLPAHSAVFEAAQHLATGPVPVREHFGDWAEAEAEYLELFGPRVGCWLVLGELITGTLVLDGATGGVHALPLDVAEEGPDRPYHADLSSLAAFLLAFQRELPYYGEGGSAQELRESVERLTAGLTALEPRALAEPASVWRLLLDEIQYGS